MGDWTNQPATSKDLCEAMRRTNALEAVLLFDQTRILPQSASFDEDGDYYFVACNSAIAKIDKADMSVVTSWAVPGVLAIVIGQHNVCVGGDYVFITSSGGDLLKYNKSGVLVDDTPMLGTSPAEGTFAATTDAVYTVQHDSGINTLTIRKYSASTLSLVATWSGSSSQYVMPQLLGSQIVVSIYVLDLDLNLTDQFSSAAIATYNFTGSGFWRASIFDDSGTYYYRTEFVPVTFDYTDAGVDYWISGTATDTEDIEIDSSFPAYGLRMYRAKGDREVTVMQWLGDLTNPGLHALWNVDGATKTDILRYNKIGLQTEWQGYRAYDKVSLGTPDGGATVPADNALYDNGCQLVTDNLLQIRAALEPLYAAYIKSGDDVYDDAADMLEAAFGDRTQHGATGGARDSWTRSANQMQAASRVTVRNVAYRCKANHTASDSNKPGSGASWTTYWIRLGAGAGSPWQTGAAYYAPKHSTVAGTDGAQYDCIEDHTSSDARRPVTGANWRTYWRANGDTGGAAWADETDYTSANLYEIDIGEIYDVLTLLEAAATWYDA